MQRNFSCQALALRVKASGESNREAWFLTGREGLLRATIFGGPKSRLRSRAAPFHDGMLWVYHDPVRDSWKVTDFDVESYRQGIRELYERAMAANAVAETILSSHGGGGNWEEAMALAKGVLDAINNAEAALCPPLAVYFLWQWAFILGIRPELEDSMGRDEPAGFIGGFHGQRDSTLQVSPGARQWLTHLEPLPPSGVTLPADQKTLEQAAALAKAVLASALGKSLNTWENI